MAQYFRLPTISIPAPVGGATSANQTLEIASLSSIDSKTPALVSGRQPVDGSGVTQPISAAALPLPTGASTAANQTATNGSLSSIDSKVPVLGQASATASMPVVLPAAQIAALAPLASVAVTQAVGTNLHAVIDNFPATQAVSGTIAVTQAIGTSLHAVIDSGTVSVSAIASALPAGANAIGSVTVSNLPSTQPISGAVSVSNFPATQATTVTNFPATQATTVTNFPSTQPISGAVSVSNFPATQATTVSNFPATQATTVSNFPSTQAIAGTGAAGAAATGVITVQGIAGATAIPISGTVVATNSANGVTATPVPAQTTLIGGSDGTNLRSFKTSVTGVLIVDGSAVVQPVSNATLPLPANAAQETGGNLAAINAKVPALGQAVKALSTPVTLASDQPAIPFIGSALNLTTASIVALNGDVVPSVDVSNYSSVLLQLTGTWAGTVSFQGSNDNVTFVSVNGQTVSATNSTAVQSSTVVGAFIIPVQARFLRIRVTAYTSGTVTGAGTALSNPPQDMGQRTVAINGTITTTGTTTATLAAGTATVGFINSAGTAFANAPTQNVYSTTNVTTAAFVQLIAATSVAANTVDIFDSSGQPMILALGAAGSEVINYYVPPGGGTLKLLIPIASRVSIKALNATANTGIILLNLLR